LEEGLELLAVTGVEDQLQADVRSTLECLRHAGVKVWMLTGDKLETATCIAHSSGLVPSGLPLFSLRATSRVEASNQLNALSAQTDTALAVDGATLQILLRHLRADFIDAACKVRRVLCFLLIYPMIRSRFQGTKLMPAAVPCRAGMPVQPDAKS
jgi:phospholipid-translocating ATPase